MLPALCVIMALKLKQQTSSSCVAYFFFAENRQKLLNISIKIDASLKKFNDEMLLDTLLFGCNKYKETINKEVFLHTINFLKTTKCFERPLFDL